MKTSNDDKLVAPQDQEITFNGIVAKSWSDYEHGCAQSFHGGYAGDEEKLEAYQQGMRRVFLVLSAFFPPAEQCKAAGKLLAGARDVLSSLVMEYGRESVEKDYPLLIAAIDKADGK